MCAPHLDVFYAYLLCRTTTYVRKYTGPWRAGGATADGLNLVGAEQQLIPGEAAAAAGAGCGRARRCSCSPAAQPRRCGRDERVALGAADGENELLCGPCAAVADGLLAGSVALSFQK